MQSIAAPHPRLRMGLKGQLRSAAALLCLLLAGVLAIAVWSVNYLQGELITDMEARASRERIAGNIAIATLECRRFEKDMFLNLSDPSQYRQYHDQWRAAFLELETAIAAYGAYDHDPAVRERVAAWKDALTIYGAAMRQVDLEVASGAITSPGAANAAIAPAKQSVRQLTESAVDAAVAEQAAIQADVQAARLAGVRVLVTVAAVGGMLLLGAIAWSVVFPPRLLRPLAELQAATQQLAQGKLSTRVDARRSDEIGSLQASFNRMAATIEEQRAGLVNLEVAEAARAEAEAAQRSLAEQLATVEMQRNVIREMSVPVLPVMSHTLVMPLVGALDTERIELVQDEALRALEQSPARTLILDVTGVPIVDTQVAAGLLRVVQAARLLGAEAVLVGIRPEVAQSMVGLGVELEGVTTRASLQSAIGAVLESGASR